MSISSWRDRSRHRSASDLPPPFVRKMYGLLRVSGYISGWAARQIRLTYTVIPYLFSPLRTFIASMASGMGRPPRMSTPSISKAKAKLSATTSSETGGVMGESVVDAGVHGEAARVAGLRDGTDSDADGTGDPCTDSGCTSSIFFTRSVLAFSSSSTKLPRWKEGRDSRGWRDMMADVVVVVLVVAVVVVVVVVIVVEQSLVRIELDTQEKQKKGLGGERILTSQLVLQAFIWRDLLDELEKGK
jgi:hypothetical protein